VRKVVPDFLLALGMPPSDAAPRVSVTHDFFWRLRSDGYRRAMRPASAGAHYCHSCHGCAGHKSIRAGRRTHGFRIRTPLTSY
jgi:hypothetical protein